MFVIRHKIWFFGFSFVLVAAAIAALVGYGLNLGPDFTGGTILELEYVPGARPTPAAISEALGPLGLGNVAVQPTGESGVLLRLRHVDEPTHQKILAALRLEGSLTEKRFSTIGPLLGQELARKGIVAIVIVVLLIIIYVALAFRAVGRQGGPASSWKYGLIAVITLAHDVIIPVGVFAWLGYYYGVEVDALFLTALLTILGLSVNDTIVIFDRIRENLHQRGAANFDETVGRSLRQTVARSFNTSFTVILVLVAVFLFGSDTTRYFALALAIGMVVGTYSSIFVAAPLLAAWGRPKRN